YLTPILGPIKLQQLTALDVLAMHTRLFKDDVSGSEQRKVATTLRAALKDALRLKLVAANVAREVDKPKATARKEMRPLDADQARVFLAEAAKERLSALYRLGFDAGMRPGELFALHWPDVVWDANAVRVQWSLEEIGGKARLKRPKTTASRRT